MSPLWRNIALLLYFHETTKKVVNRECCDLEQNERFKLKLCSFQRAVKASPPDIFDVSRIKSSDIHVLQELDGNKAASSCIVIIEWSNIKV
ncbi:hypothetical protein D918_07816 [Trichuris suis]|nr:hypothetical protein D918_07816 [Trichuris suis]